MMDVVDEARGRWPTLLAQLGVDEKFLKKKNGPCPFCGGKDRYRFTDHEQRGMWWCNTCGTGDGFELLKRLNGWSFVEAKDEIRRIIPGVHVVRDDQAANRARAVAALNRLRQEAVPAAEVPEVVAYLHGRGLEVPPGLEAHPELPYYDGGKEIGRFPAMLGRVRLASGRPVTYHRTYVLNGKKAPVPSPRKMMRPPASAKGGAIRLWPVDDVLGIAEGIETAIAASILWGCPVWSVVCANGLTEFDVPRGVSEVVVFGDRDESFTGQAAAFAAAKRFVLGLKIKAKVRIPWDSDDWNEFLCSGRRVVTDTA